MNINLARDDIEIFNAIKQESIRQEKFIELIASENYVSLSIMEAQGSILTNKYAEGYPSYRYYSGCKYIDIIEELAIKRAKILFNAHYVNVQPHSGSQANLAVYFALLKPGDTILGMSLSHGGHLTHGAKINYSGQLYKSIQYGVNDNGIIDYDQVESLALKYKPKMIIAGFSAYSQILDFENFRDIADKINCYLMVDISHVAGLVAANLYPNPIQFADVVTSTTHKTLRGPRGGLILAKKNEEIEKKLSSAVFPGIQGGPLEHVIAAKAICFKKALTQEFKIYQQQVLKNSNAMVKIFLKRGFDIISGSTCNHLFLVSLLKQGLTGASASKTLERAHIAVNKNTIPNDVQSPNITSGIRIGTPAITTRGFKETECYQVANWICDILENIDKECIIIKIREQVTKLCTKFPVYMYEK